jgi:hypothetical protein
VLDFRYHAVTIVAVLVALTLGVLLGVAIGDKGLVSSAENDLRSNLRQVIHDRNKNIEDLKGQLKQQSEVEKATYPLLVGERLPGQRVALIFLGDNDEKITSLVKQSLQGTGATLSLDAAVREPLDLGALSDRAKGTRYALMESDPSLISPFGDRMGSQLVLGGGLIRRERSALFRSASGRLTPAANAVIVVRNEPDGMTKVQQAQVNDFETGFMRGIRNSGNDTPLVGVGTTETDPSQTDWYRENGASSVSNLDEFAGRASLVFVLSGNDGAYGHGSGEQLLPALSGGTSQTP